VARAWDGFLRCHRLALLCLAAKLFHVGGGGGGEVMWTG
jgi:hypothetical protein